MRSVMIMMTEKVTRIRVGAIIWRSMSSAEPAHLYDFGLLLAQGVVTRAVTYFFYTVTTDMLFLARDWLPIFGTI